MKWTTLTKFETTTTWDGPVIEYERESYATEHDVIFIVIDQASPPSESLGLDIWCLTLRVIANDAVDEQIIYVGDDAMEYERCKADVLARPYAYWLERQL